MTFKKTSQNKGVKPFKKKKSDNFFVPDEIIQRSERKMKVVHQKDDKNKAISLR